MTILNLCARGVMRASRGGRPRNGAAKDVSAARQKAYRNDDDRAEGAQTGSDMTSEQQPTTIKKYANRRLYNTGSSTYVTLEDLAQMVKRGEDFVVYDAKSGEDLTRAVLAQVIFEQEAKVGQSLLPITFLRQLIRFYGDSMQMIVPSYLEFSLERFVADRQNFGEHLPDAFGVKGTIHAKMFEALEEQTRKNMAMFQQALTMFNPFAATLAEGGAAQTPTTIACAGTPATPQAPDAEIEDMRRQLESMQKAIEDLVKKG
jgi:polyhydroxyalkanoate synthesis repressor PhaR